MCEVAKHERTPTTVDGVRKAALLLFPPFERAQLEGSGADAVTGSRTQSIMAKDKKKAKKRKAEAAAAAAAQSSSDAASAAEESVDDIFAALAKPSKTAKKAATKPTKCEPARRRDDDDAGDDAWRAGGGETDYYGKQRDPKVHRCVPARPPPPAALDARRPQVHARGSTDLQVLPPGHAAGGRRHAPVPLRLRVLFLIMSEAAAGCRRSPGRRPCPVVS